MDDDSLSMDCGYVCVCETGVLVPEAGDGVKVNENEGRGVDFTI